MNTKALLMLTGVLMLPVLVACGDDAPATDNAATAAAMAMTQTQAASASPTLDATSDAAMRASVEAMAEQGDVDKVTLNRAIRRIIKEVQQSTELTGDYIDRESQAQQAIADRLHGLKAEQIIAEAEVLQQRDAQAAEQGRAKRRKLIEQMKANMQDN